MNIFTLLSKQWKTAFVLITTIPLAYNCIETPADFVAPKWETELTVQLIKRTYFFDDLVRKDSAKYSTVNGELVYKPASLVNATEPITIPNMQPVSASFNRQLGIIPLTAVTVPGFSLAPPGLAGNPLAVQIVIDTTITVGDTSIYDYLIYEDGQMKMVVTNTFNFDFTFTTPIQIFNCNPDGSIIGLLGQFTIGLVGKNGQTKEDSFDLSTLTQYATLKIKFRLESELPVFPFVTINSGALSANMIISKNGGGDPTLSEAKMLLKNEFVITATDIKDSVQQLSDSIKIKNVSFKNGQFEIVINNQIPFAVKVSFSLREFVNSQTQESFKLIDTVNNRPDTVISIGGKQVYKMNVQMKDYQIQARKVDGISTDTLTTGIHFSLNIRALISSPTKTVIKKTDSVSVSIEPGINNSGTTEYILDVVQGRIPPLVIPINKSTEAGIGSSTESFSADSVIFDGAQIILKIFTNSLFPTDLRMVVSAITGGIAADSLASPPGTGVNQSPDNFSYRIFPGDTAKIIFDKAHPGAYGNTIDRFLSKFIKKGRFAFPERFDISGQAVIEPMDQYISPDPNQFGTVKNGDSVFTSMEFSFPLKIGIVNGLYLVDTASIANNVDTSLTSSILEGTIGFNLTSTFPIGLDIYTNLIKADPSDSTKPSTDTLTNSVIKFPKDSSSLPLGVPGALDNQVKIEYREIVLTGDDAKKISEAKFNAVQIKMSTAANNGNTPLAFVREDSIQVITIANIKFKVDYDKFK